MSQHIKHGCDHIFFIGFLGAGKSTLARNVGTMFKRRFIDTDRLVVRRCGKSVTEIFETEGEDRFANSRPRHSVRFKASAACWYRAGWHRRDAGEH